MKHCILKDGFPYTIAEHMVKNKVYTIRNLTYGCYKITVAVMGNIHSTYLMMYNPVTTIHQQAANFLEFLATTNLKSSYSPALRK